MPKTVTPPPDAAAPAAGLDRRSLAQRVFDHLKAEILSGRLAPGTRIAEEQIVARLAVSRTPVREALRQLAEYGLVFLKPRSWAEVIRFDAQDAAEVLEVRTELETLIIRRLAGRLDAGTAARLAKIRNEAGRALAAGNIAAVFTLDSDWHLALAQASGHRLALSLLERLDARVQCARVQRCTNVRQITADLAMHETILAALTRGDTDAAAACMRRHIRRTS